MIHFAWRFWTNHRSQFEMRHPLRLSKPRVMKHVRVVSCDYRSLEHRQMLAGISWNSVSREVEVQGTPLDDVVLVSEVAPDSIRVSLSGFGAMQFSIEAVSAIRFWGRHGDDFFLNQTRVNSFAYGHAGNDTLKGGEGVDRFQGGHGDDRLEGGGGNDGLRGNVGNDVLLGGMGNDFMYGGSGNDNMNGEEGNDRVAGNDGDDTVRGGLGDDTLLGNEGDDQLLGQGGDDWISGGAGRDHLLGGSGADVLFGEQGDDRLEGEGDNDSLYGGDDNDTLFGGAGNDTVNGGSGDDVLNGGSGEDLLVGGIGRDSLFGSSERDVLLGDDGDDWLDGGGDDDLLYGGSGNDVLFGNAGNDKLFGEAGDDDLWGQSGTDELDGGPGLDGLFGGIGGNDRLVGGSGGDRFLTWSGDVVLDSGASDGVIRFVNRTGVWSETEIGVIDEGLRLLHERVGNGRIFQDSLDDEPVQFVKYSQLAGVAQNFLTTRNTNGVITYDREIRFADWDEQNAISNSIYRFATIHEIGHSWDSALEINNRLPGMGGVWNSFLTVSGWRSTDPNSNSYQLSGDGEWWHLRTAVFVRDYGRHNPFEDWSTVWEILLDPTQTNKLSQVSPKAVRVNQLLDAF